MSEPVITLDWLCEIFGKTWGVLSVENIRKALAAKLDIDWFAEKYLSPRARAEYERVTAPARAEYDRVTAQARAECDRVRASSRAEYDRVKGETLILLLDLDAIGVAKTNGPVIPGGIAGPLAGCEGS